MTLKEINILPFPFVKAKGFNWATIKKINLLSNSFSVGYRWFREGNVRTLRYLFFFSSKVYTEEYWTFSIKSKTLNITSNIRYFDSIEIGDLSTKHTFITPAFGSTFVNRNYTNNQIGEIQSVSTFMLGYNFSTNGKKMYPLSEVSAIMSNSVYF